MTVADVLTREQRSRCMAAIKGRNTKPEIRLRSALWRCGLRFRVKSKLIGRPDIVFPTARVVVFVDGCFWHGCKLHCNKPATNSQFWAAKLAKNRQRDSVVNAALRKAGWRVVRVWEHELDTSEAQAVRRIARIVAGRPKAADDK